MFVFANRSCEPIRPYSSLPQDANKILRLGLQPCFISSPKALITSRRTHVPELGSIAPKTHASRWFPIMIYLSGSSTPSIYPITSLSEINGLVSQMVRCMIRIFCESLAFSCSSFLVVFDIHENFFAFLKAGTIAICDCLIIIVWVPNIPTPRFLHDFSYSYFETKLL